jgi:hypothetical protein
MVKHVAALDHHQQREHQERHGEQEAEPLIGVDAGGGDQHHQERVPAVAPVDLGQPLAGMADGEDRDRERHHQAGHQLRHHAGAGRGDGAERQVAAQREHENAKRDEEDAGGVVGTQGHA